MVVNLNKGQSVSLKKSENNLSQVTIGLGWDVAAASGGLMGKLFGSKPVEYDLDVITFLLNERGKVASLGEKLIGGDVIFFNNLKHVSGNVWLSGDNRTGAGEGDDEQVVLLLNQIDRSVRKIVFVVQIYEAAERRQDFGSIENAFIRAVDGSGREMVRYSISGRRECAGMRTLHFADLVRKDDVWDFVAIGRPETKDSFVDILKRDYV